MNYPELDDVFMNLFQDITTIPTDNFKFVTRTDTEDESGCVVVVPVYYARPLSKVPKTEYNDSGARIMTMRCITSYRLVVIGADMLEYLRNFLERYQWDENVLLADSVGISVTVMPEEETSFEPTVINNGIEITATVNVAVRHSQVTVITAESDTIKYATTVRYEGLYNKEEATEQMAEVVVSGFYNG
jgi:hypothetical protein